MSSAKASGAEGRKRRKIEAQKSAKRERKRSGLNQEWADLLQRIGDPPLDPVGNSEWANNMAAGMASIIAKDKQLPMEDRFKRTAEMLDRVAYTQAKASTAKRIREVKEAAGIAPAKKLADGVVQVGTGSSLRAGRSTRGGGAISGSMPEFQAQSDGGGTSSGGGAVGSNEETIP